MSNLKSFGQLLDEYLTDYPDYETVFLYHDKNENTHLVVTQAEYFMDDADVFSEAIDLRSQIEEKKKELTALEKKVKAKQAAFREVEGAIKKLMQYRS